jgi:hypothetical protein
MNDYINWKPTGSVDVFYGQLCGDYIGVLCISHANGWHVSGGIEVGIPGISLSFGSVRGGTADHYLCGESVTAGANYFGGGEVGANPGPSGAVATGIQFGSPGFGISRTWGSC